MIDSAHTDEPSSIHGAKLLIITVSILLFIALVLLATVGPKVTKPAHASTGSSVDHRTQRSHQTLTNAPITQPTETTRQPVEQIPAPQSSPTFNSPSASQVQTTSTPELPKNLCTSNSGKGSCSSETRKSSSDDSSGSGARIVTYKLLNF